MQAAMTEARLCKSTRASGGPDPHSWQISSFIGSHRNMQFLWNKNIEPLLLNKLDLEKTLSEVFLLVGLVPQPHLPP